MELPKRKQNRIKGYDYDNSGAYFLTVCTKNRENLLWDVGASIARPNEVSLSVIGQIVNRAILAIPTHYPAVSVDKYVIMPNHVHLLITIKNENGRAMPAPTTSRIIQQMKGAITKQIGQNIWQKLFHDHVVRGETDYKEIWQYIEHNPIKWSLDRYYSK